MRFKILVDPHPFLESVQKSLQNRYDAELLSLGSAIQHYAPKCTTEPYLAPANLNLKNDTLFGFPSWFTENASTIERIVVQSLTDQLNKYGPWIEAMDLCLQNEDISLILLWNDVTALTKSLTFLGKKYGIPSLHVSHGIPLTAVAHGKIWADKIAVFGDSSREFYTARGNQPEKTVITGNPYWDNWGPCSPHDVNKIKEALGLKNDKKVVMYAPTWYHNLSTATDPELKVKKDLEILLDTLSQLKLVDKVDLLVKLHGGHGDKAAFYDRNIKARGFSYKIIAEASPLPLIQVSDVVLCAGSMVVEALLAGKPVIYNVCDRFESEQHFDSFMSHSFALGEAPFYVALNRDDLSRDISRALNNCNDFSTEKVKKFLHRQNGPCDGKATERVAELAIKMAGNNKNKENRVKFISPVSYRKRETYYSNIRQDIPSIITGNPQRILEVGCAEGAMGSVLRKKYNCEYIGVEVNSEAAHKAEERLDHVIIADVEKTNLKDHRIAETGFDYIIYGDVLEHLYDPWTVIYEHKKLLKDDGYVVASIPNVRNLKIIESLVSGNWTYKDEGILDSTHLRFFTLQEVKKMFINCGYDIVDVKCVTNPVFDFNKSQGHVNIDLPKMTIKNVSKEEMLELSTVQFMIKAQKTTVSESVSHPKCSIIIPVFNQVEYTRQCIEALYKNTPSSLFEIIVVDNNSTDGTKDYLSGIPEKVKVITNIENLGFAKACNQGADLSRGYYLVFLNNDTLPQPGWLREMVDSANSDADAGIVGTKLLYPDGTIQHAGIGFINGIPDHPFRDFPGDHPEANIPKELDMVTGACLLIKRDVFIECGGFDEQYKNGVEDIDLCLKARMKGYKVIYNPKSTLYHYEGRTPGRFDHVKENLEIFFSRWGDYFDDHGKFFNKAEDKKILIRWEGSQFVNHSLALVNRELCLELAKRQNIELSLIPYEPNDFGLEEDPDRFDQIEERLRKTLSGKADFHIRHQWPPNFSPPTEGHWIIMQPWEFGALPKNWVEPMETHVDEIWVPSNYVRDVYINSGISASKVFVVPNGVNYHQFNPAVTKYKLDTSKRFKFLFVGGTIMRKGIDILLEAFTTAFSNNDDVCLVIKDMGGESFYRGQNASQIIEEIKKNPTSPEILYITEILNNEEVAGLYTACDCLVHPYRGEGFGLPVAEAMACGLPVIVTKGGACDDFCSEENAYLIDSTVKPVHLDNYVLSAPGWLLEPDKTQLIKRLRFVCEQPEKAKQKGALAARQIRNRVDWKMSTNQIMDRLRDLKGKPVKRFAASSDSQVVQTAKLPQDIYQTIQQSMENKRLEEVINELEMLAESCPQFALAQNDLGVLHYQAGNREMALKFYENAVQLDPGNMIFQKNLADFYYVELGRVEEALRIYVKILEANPEDVETLLITGHICVALEKFQDAEVFYSRVLEIQPGHQDALQYLDKLKSMKTGDSKTQTPEELYREVQPLLNNGDHQRAISALERLLERFPDFAIAHNDLGVLCYHTGDKEKAQQHYERAVELTPDNISFQKNLADFYCIELGRIEDALKIYVSLLKIDPQDVETLMATGQICVAFGKPDDARDFFSKVLEIEPWNEAALQHLEELERPSSSAGLINSESLDEIYQRLQQNLGALSQTEAIDEFEKLLDSYPDFALGHNDLGVLYYHTGDKEKSLDHYRQAAQLQPENITFQKNLAEFLFVELGKIEEALQIYVNILTLNPHDIETLLITGHICVALKKFDDARDFYLRVLELEPGNEDAGNNLQELDKHEFGNGSSPSEPANTFSALTDKTESDDFELDRSAVENQAAAVSIVISLNGIQNRVKECLKSVRDHTSDPHEILLINRGAAKGILKWAQQLAKDNEHYCIIECSRQRGQAESINKAIQKASGEMVVLLHNDVVVPEGWLNAFKMCINFVPNIGVVGPVPNRTAGIQQMAHSDELDRDEFESAAKAYYEQNRYRRIATRKLSVFCLAFRRELPDKIGYLDEQFVSEDVVVEDFCNRAASGGYQNLIAADTYVHHYDRHPVKKNATTKNSTDADDQKKYKEKWNGNQNPEAKAFQTVQLLARAVELSQSGQTDAAVETVLGAIGLQPENQRLYLSLSEILLTAKRFQDAKEALLEMPSADDNQEMRKAELLGYAEEGLENFETAQDHIEQVLAMNPDRAQALNLKGILAYRNDDRHCAEKYFKRAIDADPGFGEPYTNLGMLQLEADQPEEALKSFEKSFRLTPTDLDIATNYHALIAGMSEYGKAENIARDAAFLYPNNQKIKYMLIDFLVQQGKYELAMTEIEEAIIKFGIDNGILAAALKVREKLGPMSIRKSSKKAPVSLCMIIKDEEKYLARCLASVKPIVDEMIVIDTGSADRSKDIAITFGAKVYDYEWKNDFGEARNYSIQKASGEWILILDGDEVISALDHAYFNQIVKKTPRAPVAYSITTRNYNKLANIVGWMPNDGQYPDEEAAIGWLPSEKVRLFYGKDQIWFEGAVHELVDPVLKRNSIEIKKCRIPVHHYGRLNKEKLDRKGEIYFDIGQKKLSEMGDDMNALRELAIQATILEKNPEAFELWQRLLALNPSPNLAAIAYVNMGTIYNRLGKFEHALDAAQKAVECDPGLKEARYNQAMAELHCGNAPNTINLLEELLSGFPDYPPAQFILSAAYFCGGQKEKGLEGIRKIKDTPVGAHLDFPCLELAQSLISARKMEYALWVLEAAIESDIVNPQIMALFNECLSMTAADPKCSYIPPSPQANFQDAILENLPQ